MGVLEAERVCSTVARLLNVDLRADFASSLRVEHSTSPNEVAVVAKSHILGADVRHVVATGTGRGLLPADVSEWHDAWLEHGPYCLQVIHVRDLGASLFSQLERLEDMYPAGAAEGQSVIVPKEEEDASGMANESTAVATLKLVLQDGAGTMVYALTDRPIPGLRSGIPLGAKMLVGPRVQVLRGVLMLDPSNTTVWGGSTGLNDGYYPHGLMQELRDELERAKQT